MCKLKSYASTVGFVRGKRNTCAYSEKWLTLFFLLLYSVDLKRNLPINKGCSYSNAYSQRDIK